jgi:membrane-associated phospholipid phosphatase
MYLSVKNSVMPKSNVPSRVKEEHEGLKTVAGKPAGITGETTAVPNSWFFSVAPIIVFMICYSIVGQLTSPQKILPFILEEQSIPFLPWTVIIYFSVFFQIPFIIRHTPKTTFFKAMPILSVGVILSFTAFILFPISYPRELYQGYNTIITNLFKTDPPGNCFPSLHVFNTVFFASCYSWTEKSVLKICLMWFWTTLIVVSVLTVKQHYLLDVFGGIALAVVAIYLTKIRIANERNIPY